MEETFTPHTIIIGGGIAGHTAAMKITNREKKVLMPDQETKANIGRRAFWLFGGLFLVDSPFQHGNIKDSYELARQGWMESIGFGREEDHWPGLWTEAYVN